MAKRTTRSSSRGARAPRGTTKATSRKAASTEVEVLDDEGGGNIDTGIIIITTIVMVAAFLMIDRLRGMYGEGIF